MRRSPAPVIASLSVAGGTYLGGTAVTITGTGFLAGATVDFGGAAGTSVVVVSDTSITCVSPAHASAVVSVTVTCGGQTSAGVNYIFYSVPQAELDSLVYLYNATNGPSWTNHTNWLTAAAVGTWYGVTVASGHVTVIDITANGATVSGNISGWTLPASLQHLYLHGTSVSGDISGWTLPASLQDLYLYSTSVSGDISGWTLPASLTIPVPLQHVGELETSAAGRFPHR